MSAPLVLRFLDDPGDMAEIFERSEFDRSPGWWERLRTSIGDFFDSLSFSWLGPVGQFLMWLVLIAAAGALLWWIARLWRNGAFRRRKRPTPAEVPTVVPIDLDTIADPAQLADARDAFEAALDYKQAILARYRQLVAVLMERGVVSREPGRTTGELRDEVATRRPILSPTFGPATELFEVVWFSDHGGSAEELAQLDRWAHDTLAHLGAVGTAPTSPASATASAATTAGGAP